MSHRRPPLSWVDAINRFVTHLAKQGKSERTQNNYRADVTLFGLWYQAQNDKLPELSELRTDQLETWKDHLDGSKPKKLTKSPGKPGQTHSRHQPVRRRRAPQTIYRKLSALRSFVRWAQGNGWCLDVEVPRAVHHASPPPRCLTREEEKRFYQAVGAGNDVSDWALAQLLGHCGLRITEAASLEWPQVRIADGEVTIVGKGRKHRTVPLDEEVRNALAALQRATKRRKGRVFRGQRGPLSESGLSRVIAKYGNAAKLNVTARALHHTYCRRLGEQGKRFDEIADRAGHESIDRTRRNLERRKPDRVVAIQGSAGEKSAREPEPTMNPGKVNRRPGSIQPPPTSRFNRFTVAQYEKILEQLGSGGVELIDGHVLEKISKKPPRILAVAELRCLLQRALPPQWHVREEHPVSIPEFDNPEPDLAVVRGTPRAYASHHTDVGLVVDVAETMLEVYRGEKLRAYARGGIPIYWIVNLVDRQVEVCATPHPDGYLSRTIYTAGREVPFVLDGRRLGRFPVVSILPTDKRGSNA